MINSDKYINPRLSLDSLDTYVMRSSIFVALKKAVPLFSGTLLDVGCGYMPYRELILSSGKVDCYIGLDLEKNDNYSNKPELTWDGTKIPLDDNSVDCAMATELFEHCPEPEAVMKEICRVLCPGGILFFTVPFLWPLHDVPHDQYRYTPFALERHLKNSGFQDIRILPLGGWDKCLAQLIGLYVRRRPKSWPVRFLLTIVACPLVYLLSRSEGVNWSRAQGEFRESSMLSGLWGSSYKPGSCRRGSVD